MRLTSLQLDRIRQQAAWDPEGAIREYRRLARVTEDEARAYVRGLGGGSDAAERKEVSLAPMTALLERIAGVTGSTLAVRTAPWPQASVGAAMAAAWPGCDPRRTRPDPIPWDGMVDTVNGCLGHRGDDACVDDPDDAEVPFPEYWERLAELVDPDTTEVHPHDPSDPALASGEAWGFAFLLVDRAAGRCVAITGSAAG